jgi:glycosyltransferase involved in cell wall biosynthesis/GT2 family glycosyltransferase
LNRFISDDCSPSFSIVINTLNRASLLSDAINGVLQLNYPSIELIVVNGPSIDHSEDVLGTWQGKIKHLRCDVPNLSVSRNVGIAGAAGDIVAFLDDDAVPHPLWLRHLARHYADPSVGAVGGFTVDNTGVRWQVRKTICDRFGNAYFPDDLFDDRALNFPGTPYYPSLLGTNSSFRRKALREIGGFDHTFAYLLDETDVCLRLVDAGWHVLYEPAAMIFHQFAESYIRSRQNKPKTLYPSVVSKTYFINRHGQAEGYGKVAQALQEYREELFRANEWMDTHGDISPNHRAALDSDVEMGTQHGIKQSYKAILEAKSLGDLDPNDAAEPFHHLPERKTFRVALVSQGLPPDNDAGIARWSMLLAKGLRDLGIVVHLVSRAKSLPSRRFRDGIWFHEVERSQDDASGISVRYNLPKSNFADWMAGITRELAFIKTFGLDLVSFPIWDLEALPVLDDPDLAAVMSLHTTYKLARPFKPEWNSRIVFGRSFVDRMIAAEKQALDRAPHILANSQAVIDEIETSYGVEIAAKCRIVPHGTPDILANLGIAISDKAKRRRAKGQLRVLFAGRFEARKGYDLALRVAAKLAAERAICFDFVGTVLDDVMLAKVKSESGIDPRDLREATFHGEVDRQALDFLYANSDVILMPSRFESFGLVAIEAMSAGSPVIALASGGLVEVVTEPTTGYLFSDDESFVEGAARKLLEFSKDEAKLMRIQETSHASFAERFSVEAMSRDVAAFYEEIIIARRRAQ